MLKRRAPAAIRPPGAGRAATTQKIRIFWRSEPLLGIGAVRLRARARRGWLARARPGRRGGLARACRGCLGAENWSSRAAKFRILGTENRFFCIWRGWGVFLVKSCARGLAKNPDFALENRFSDAKSGSRRAQDCARGGPQEWLHSKPRLVRAVGVILSQGSLVSGPRSLLGIPQDSPRLSSLKLKNRFLCGAWHG